MLDDLASRWKTKTATIHDLSALRFFPRQVDVGLYDLRRVEAVEDTHGGKEKLVQWIKLYEDAWTADVDVQGDSA